MVWQEYVIRIEKGDKLAASHINAAVPSAATTSVVLPN
jgi:hypothetical protein